MREPRAFLMDEPLTNLDLKLRVEMRTELTRIHRSMERTFLYVTNDQVEAMSMADRVAVLREGSVQPPSPSSRSPDARQSSRLMRGLPTNVPTHRFAGRL